MELKNAELTWVGETLAMVKSINTATGKEETYLVKGLVPRTGTTEGKSHPIEILEVNDHEQL